ncbi:MAG: tetratricopeptide repeat protein [Deltaproteobacteria bacterium]|nr:tetratricopeptide repeat protein [Deltaproteobacteria bacterium]
MGEDKQRIVAILMLVAWILVLYWPVAGYEFIDMDDNLYLFNNPDICKGLTWKGISWAMQTFYTTNWHPLTWFSLLADYELYGMNANGYHVSSLLLHIFNTVLLFHVLRLMTGKTWECFGVAALFGVHPLNIESVAWIAERKNVLSTLFWILTLFAYVRYVKKPHWMRYLLTLTVFALGLTAKPMLVTLPVILLLLDYWPLGRISCLGNRAGSRAWDWKSLWPIVKEKIPFFLLTIPSVLITLHAAKIGGAIKSMDDLPLVMRTENAFISYVTYLKKMIWPLDLAIFYPYPTNIPLWQAAAAFCFLLSVTVLVVIKHKRYPNLVTGWFWYLITLLPVIGIIQVGYQAMANRYVYVPLIGIFMILTWGLSQVLQTLFSRWIYYALMTFLILIFSFSTWSQLPNWRNSAAAFDYALKVTKDNFIAQCGMGDVWQNSGIDQIARLYYQEALRIKPSYPEAHNNLAMILIKEGRIKEAEAEFRKAIMYKPNLVEAHNNLGAVLCSRRAYQEAADHFARALELMPGYVTAKENLDKIKNVHMQEAKRQ